MGDPQCLRVPDKTVDLAARTPEDDLNFFRFLTTYVSVGAEEPLVGPLFRPLTKRQLYDHCIKYNTHGYLASGAKKMRLYLQIPFCAAICSFCHCVHHELKGPEQLRRYVGFVLEQIDEFSGLFDNITFGAFTVLGGTGSLLTAPQIKMIYEAIMGKFRFDADPFFSFEGHPSSLTAEKLKLLKGFGVKTIHLGVQSMDEEVLKRINRFQTREGIKQCIHNMKKCGFSCVNADLVAGLPGQTTESFLDDIKTLVEWGVDLFNLHPFSDITSASCSKDASLSLQEVLKFRHEMILEGKKLLEGYGYGNKGQLGYLKGAVHENTNFEPHRYVGGTLGLGVFVKSSIPGEIVFDTSPPGDDFSVGWHNGYATDKKYWMAQYAFVHLLYGLDTGAFHKVFGQEFSSVFAEEMPFLLDRQMIIKNNEGYCYAGSRTLQGLFDYFSHVKILLGDKIITDLRKNYASRYVPSTQYGSKEDLLKVFQGLDYAREYYRVGRKTVWI